MELWDGAEMQQDAQVYAERFDVVAELAARAFGKAFGGFDLDYYPSLDQHIDAVEPDLSALEAHGHGVFAIDSQPALLHRNLKCAGIEQLHEPVPKLIVNIKKQPTITWLSSFSMMTACEDLCPALESFVFIRVIRTQQCVAVPPKSFPQWPTSSGAC